VTRVTLIRTEQLTKRYGQDVWALRDVDLAIARDEWIAVMGPSGSGKSTLLNILGALDRPTSGRVEVDGVHLGALDQRGLTRFRREHVGFVFQQFHLIPYLSALENVMVAQYYHSMPDAAEARVALERVGLGPRTKHLPHQLSGGEQQRVCIARALINSPALLLADEPTGNLDEENKELVLRLLAELHQEGHTIITVTHDPEVAERTDRTLTLRGGRLVTVSVNGRDEEHVDHVLEEMWLAGEGPALMGDGERRSLGELGDTSRVVARLVDRGLVTRSGESVALSHTGVARAADIVRRRRLAERLFSDKFRLSAEEFESGGCSFEHILTPAATESICRFLGHPPECPHGRPIPKGACCGGSS
jgi:putative ABC transport system ATP-binding protein